MNLFSYQFSRLFSFIAICLVLLPVQQSFSQEPSAEFKEAVLGNCTSAFDLALTMPGFDMPASISYLVRVVRMGAGKLESRPLEFTLPAQFSGDKPFKGIGQADVGAVFDAGRFIESRRCAIELLVVLAPNSFIVVPELIEESVAPRDADPDPEFVGRTTQSILKIANEAKLFPEHVTDDALNAIVDLLFVKPETKNVVSKVLKALGRRGINFLVSRARGENRIEILRLIGELDPSGDLAGDAMLEAYWAAAKDDIRSEFAATIARMTFPPRAGAIPVFVREVSLASDTHLGILSPLLTNHAKAGLFSSITRPSQQRLVELVELGRPVQQNIALSILGSCCLDNSATVQGLIGATAKIAPPFLVRVIEVLGTVRASASQVVDALTVMLRSSDKAVQHAAAVAIGAISEPNPRVMASLEQEIARSFASSPRDEDLLMLLIEARAALAKSRVRTVGTSITAPLVEVLPLYLYKRANTQPFHVLLPPSRLLSERGVTVLPLLVAALPQATPQVRAQFVHIAGAITPPSRPSLNFLVKALGDEDNRIQELAIRLLRGIGAPVAGLLRRELQDKSRARRTRVAIARALIAVDATAKGVVPILRAELAQAPCHERVEIAFALVQGGNKRKAPKFGNPVFDLFAEVLGCIGSVSPVVRAQVLHSLPVFGPRGGIKPSFVYGVTQGVEVGLAAEIGAALVRDRDLLGGGIGSLVSTLAPLVPSDRAAPLYVAVAEAGLDGLPLATVFEETMRNSGLDEVQQMKALVVLAWIDPTRIPFREMADTFLDSRVLADGLKLMPVSLAVPLYLYLAQASMMETESSAELGAGSVDRRIKLLESIVSHRGLTLGKALTLIEQMPVLKGENFLRMAKAIAVTRLLAKNKLDHLDSKAGQTLLNSYFSGNLATRVACTFWQ